MQLDVKGPSDWLERFKLYLGDQLANRGYAPGPRLDRIDSGDLAVFIKDSVIISVQISEEEEGSGECLLRLELETEIPEIEEIWDDAVIALGKEFLARIRALARNSKRVEQALKA